MQVVWTPEALQDRTDIWEHIATDNPDAACSLDQLFSDATARLADQPMMGRSGKIPGTRELIPHESYRMVYEVGDDIVWILTVVHTARRWPPTHD